MEKSGPCGGDAPNPFFEKRFVHVKDEKMMFAWVGWSFCRIFGFLSVWNAVGLEPYAKPYLH